jgi:hypothetical protein
MRFRKEVFFEVRVLVVLPTLRILNKRTGDFRSEASKLKLRNKKLRG